MEHMGRDYETWQVTCQFDVIVWTNSMGDIQNSTAKILQYELNLLYVVYSLPNTVLPYFGGVLVDRLGMQVFLVYSTLGCLGQLVFALGIHWKSIGIALVGRFLFGVGGESLVVVQGCLMAATFEGDELAFALGLIILYSVLPDNAKKRATVRVAVTASEVASPETLFPVEAQRVSWEADTVVQDQEDRLQDFYAERREEGEDSDATVRPSPLRDRRPRSILHNRQSSEALSLIPTESTPLLFVPPEPPHTYGFCNAFSAFPFSFWILCLMYVVFYGTAWCFNNTASDFLQSKWYPNDTVTAGLVMSIPDSTSSILVVVCGYFLDSSRFGATLLVVSFMTITTMHFILGFTVLNPVPSLIALGIAYSINPVVIWPSVAMVIQRQERKLMMSRESSRASLLDDGDNSSDGSCVEEGDKILGAAYGVCTALLNVALTVIPLCAAWIRVESGGGWAGLEAFYGGLAGIGLCGAVVLYCVGGLHSEGKELFEEEVVAF
ncbi:UNVERIFIED_CONTAM: hypothetical protein HDU68_012436 [Siphonaria sp. JEL0065]|nr:hypothetical protein HDU68_012436 [Siphonaria sp. JEL0065]